MCACFYVLKQDNWYVQDIEPTNDGEDMAQYVNSVDDAKKFESDFEARLVMDHLNAAIAKSRFMSEHRLVKCHVKVEEQLCEN